MTLNGIIRSIDAANRRANRNRERYERLLAREEKLRSRIAEADRSYLLLQKNEGQIESLTTIHREDPTVLDWRLIANTPPPLAPARETRSEKLAQQELDDFRPSLMDKLLGRTQKKKDLLSAGLIEAQSADARLYEQAVKQHTAELAAHERRTELAKAILSGDLAAYREAIDFVKPLEDISMVGGAPDVKLVDRFTIEVTLDVAGDSVVPSEIYSTTKTGKVSVKAMPKGKFFELYQDYVCGSALRIARELFGILPVRLVVIHAYATSFNSATGTNDRDAILSVAIPLQLTEKINFAACDASDSMANFIHRMGFKRSQGFSRILPLEPHEYPAGEAAAID